MDEPLSVFVGIDVSKDRLDVHLRPSGEAFSVPRDGSGPEAASRQRHIHQVMASARPAAATSKRVWTIIPSR